MVSRETLHELLDANTRLCSLIQKRTTAVDYELDRLRALRDGLCLPAAPIRKRRRNCDDFGVSGAAVSRRECPEDPSPALLAALQAIIETHAGERRSAPYVYNQGVWEVYAAALHAAGHDRRTPYELWTAFQKAQYAKTDFTAAENAALIQWVQERGYNWVAASKAFQQRFGSLRSPFELAATYRTHMRRAFVQARLTNQQLTALLSSDAVSPAYCDFDALSIEAKRFTTHRTLQVDHRYLQKEIQTLLFHSFVPAAHQLYWKIMNLMCPMSLPPCCRINALHYKRQLCYQQCGLPELARHLECTTAELKARVKQHLLGLSRSPGMISFEECSKALFGNASAARLIYLLAEEMHCGKD